MPPSAQRMRQLRRRQRALDRGITTYVDAFRWVAGRKSSPRINILVEGDSWFAYPRDWIFVGENSNLINNIFDKLTGRGLVNTLCLASNGDTAEEMLSGAQLRKLTRLIESLGEKLDLLLFSAGGNDVIGPDDLSPLLRDFEAGFTARDCIDEAALASKLEIIVGAYQTLLDLRDTFAPNMKIICHTYDILEPSDEGAELFGGIEVAGPWLLPTLREKGIPEALHVPLVRILLETFRDHLVALQATASVGFFVVDTQGTLRVGHASDWLNEIHPTPSGFKRIGAKIYAQMRAAFPELPA